MQTDLLQAVFGSDVIVLFFYCDAKNVHTVKSANRLTLCKQV